ncbi:MAG: gliding motility-associated C-terminal domain-containing protein [Saprospiraceae bacterium]|nr:gliding motility-associated C-terminal domain-containing protein [Candidatus Opimibacter skivensis]
MAVSAAGCVQEGTFFLFFNLQVRPSVYAPNVFSPDSPFNPAFTLFGNDQLVIINYLRVFSRWGEKVFELENLEPGDLSAGWDGTFRGQEVNPGVFVWVAEVVYEDGSSEVLKGDVTVIR